MLCDIFQQKQKMIQVEMHGLGSTFKEVYIACLIAFSPFFSKLLLIVRKNNTQISIQN